MYTKKIPFKDYNGNPRNISVSFNLDEREVFKLLPEFQRIFTWQDKLSKEADFRELDIEELRSYYNDLEEILLAAWGEPSEDGLHFRKTGRYDFEESKLFAACMKMFVEQPEEGAKLMNGLMPENLGDMVKNTDANLSALAAKENLDEGLRDELERLRAQVKIQST